MINFLISSRTKAEAVGGRRPARHVALRVRTQLLGAEGPAAPRQESAPEAEGRLPKNHGEEEPAAAAAKIRAKAKGPWHHPTEEKRPVPEY